MKRITKKTIMTSAAILVAVFTLTLAVNFTPFSTTVTKMFGNNATPKAYDDQIIDNAQTKVHDGRNIFRNDTFGDEDFWGKQLGLNKAVARLCPETALKFGLKVDSEALPASLLKDLKKGAVDLKDPATTLQLLKSNAVVGIKGFFDPQGNLISLGITCALCHSTVDDSLAPGIGIRLDGWANRDLDVGAIIALAPNLKPYSDLLGVDEDTVRKVLLSWGPGKFDPQLILDGKAFRPDGKSAAVLIPPAFGLAGVNLHTSTGFGSVPYWNAFVGTNEMMGKGSFFDPRLSNAEQFPISAKAGLWNVKHEPDLLTPKLPALHLYELTLPAPIPPIGSFDKEAAKRGEKLFKGKAKCQTCHVPPIFSDPGFNMHKASTIGIDDFQAMRSPTKRYRTAPLKGLWSHQKGGFYHDGRFKTLPDVIEHYNTYLNLKLTGGEIKDLTEYLKSL